MKSWYRFRATAEGAELSIHDEIGAHGVSAKAFLADLGTLPDKAPLTLRLNSPGGSVFDAVAIYNALRRHAGKVTVTIDGIAASAASYIAMAGDEIVMPENAFLMIHDPSGLVMGTSADMRAMAEALDKIGAALIRGYAARSGKAEDEIARLMAAETWFDAAEAVEAGFADRLIEPVRIAATFDIGRFRNAPPVLVDAMQAGPVSGDKSDGVSTGAADGPDCVEEAEDGLASAADAPQPSARTPPASGAPPDPAAIRAEAMAHARAVVDLCRLAGQPQMAGRFLEEDASLDEVRAHLLAARAEAGPDISATHPQPGPGPAARPWADIIDRTFKRRG